ncbi:hypothetical protein D7B24_003998 [Verticillium nonalfalfae]|uniref:PhnB-like domain-containing protein n=1 Tax=Verticillium nonalfalfae TaxID=1051616 RepID=A0A3M9YH34_9PEZI|nr:uncharacterized protein D7B24_003998 [Verticillium nonalfalfae]RNJ58908.1 hypothetical protein D7B24_003998 [Verticillium nonalfalfae]
MPIAKFTTCLWFDGNAEEAAQFYVSIFPDSKITHRQYYTSAGEVHHGQTPGSLLIIEFEMNGQKFAGLNGGPQFKFNEAISLMVDCDDQKEIDFYWTKLGEGGDVARQQCGWIADRYGLAWQVVPKVLKTMLADPDQEKSDRVMEAMMQMTKMDIRGLEQAFKAE